MRSDDLKQLLLRQPCPTLRLHLTGGVLFEIREQDHPVVTRSTVEILMPPDDGRDREAIINLLHVLWVEVVSPAE
jgi:hypothetical protein